MAEPSSVEGTDIPDLLAELDNLLYRADENGRWTRGFREVRRTVQHNGGDYCPH